jgi:hypothetical protein
MEKCPDFRVIVQSHIRLIYGGDRLQTQPIQPLMAVLCSRVSYCSTCIGIPRAHRDDWACNDNLRQVLRNIQIMSDFPADFKENLSPASLLTPSKAFSYDLNSLPLDSSRQTDSLTCILDSSPTSKHSSAPIFTGLDLSEESASLTNSMIRTEVNAILAQLGSMKQQLTTEALI